MIVTVTPNPALDYTWRAAEVILGESHRVPAGVFRAGGKGVNVARVLHAQGYAVIAVSTAGGSTGADFVSDIRGSGFGHRIIRVESDTRRSLAIVSDSSGGQGTQATVLNEIGAELGADDVDALINCALDIPDAEVVAVCGSLPAGFGDRELTRIITQARSGGARVVVDTSGPRLLTAASAGADLLKPNREELAAATGLADPIVGADELLRRGAGAVLVSLGEDGLVIVTETHLTYARYPEVIRVGNPTGAGDAAVAAICPHLGLTNWPSPDALARAARDAAGWSAAAVVMWTAGELSAEVQTMIADVVVTVTDRSIT